MEDVMTTMTPDQITERMFAILGTLFLVFSFVFLVAYIFYSYCWFLLAKKTNTENEWMAFVPILNFYLLFKIGKKPVSSFFLSFIPILGLYWAIGGIHSISTRCGKGVPMTLGLIFFGFIAIPYLAFTYPQESLNGASKSPLQPIEM